MAKQHGSFLDVLRDIEYGDAKDDIDSEWAKVARAVAEHRKAGSLTITVKAIPDKAHPTRVDVGWEMTSKLPTRDRMQTTMFSMPDGSLSRRDPRQPELPSMGERPVAMPQTTTSEMEASNG